MSPLPARLFSAVSNAAWSLSASLNAILPQGELPSPSWAPGRLLKSSERMQTITGVPRRTLSLCPGCNIESTEAVIRGQATISDFKARPGVIEAEIVEEAGRILMRKACREYPSHIQPHFRSSRQIVGSPKATSCAIKARTQMYH